MRENSLGDVQRHGMTSMKNREVDLYRFCNDPFNFIFSARMYILYITSGDTVSKRVKFSVLRGWICERSTIKA